MSLLRVHLGTGDPAAYGIPVIVEVSPHPRGATERQVCRIDGGVTFDLAAGLHGVRIDLPSGRTLTESVVLSRAGAEVFVDVGDMHTVCTGADQRVWGELPTGAWFRIWARLSGRWIPGPIEPARSTVTPPPGLRPRMLQTGGPGLTPQLVTLPPGRVEVTVKAAAENEPWLAVFVTTDDPVGESMSGYLRTGAMTQAKILHGSRGPSEFSGVAARIALGAFGLRLGPQAAEFNQVATAFLDYYDLDSLPDESILRGLLTRDEATLLDVIDAIDDGLPVYTESLRLLCAGLRKIDESVLTPLAPYLAAADLAQPTVTFAGTAPDRPDPDATDEMVPRPAPLDAGLLDELREIAAEVPEWQLTEPSWARVGQTLDTLWDSLTAQDSGRVADATTALEFAAPTRSARVEPAESAAPPRIVRLVEAILAVLRWFR